MVKNFKIEPTIYPYPIYVSYNDQKGLLKFVADQKPEHLKTIFLSHGEEESMLEFRDEIRRLGFSDVILPEKSETFTL